MSTFAIVGLFIFIIVGFILLHIRGRRIISEGQENNPEFVSALNKERAEFEDEKRDFRSLMMV